MLGPFRGKLQELFDRGLPRKKDLKNWHKAMVELRPALSAHIRFGEHGAPVECRLYRSMRPSVQGAY
jgi:hypothetical protein